MDKLEPFIGIPSDKDEFIVDVFSEDHIFGNLERIDGTFILKIENHVKNDGWEIDLEVLLDMYKKYKYWLGIDE